MDQGNGLYRLSVSIRLIVRLTVMRPIPKCSVIAYMPYAPVRYAPAVTWSRSAQSAAQYRSGNACSRQIAAPQPFPGSSHPAGPDRVQHDVASQLQKITGLVHQDALEIPLEKVAYAPVGPIDVLAEDSV